MRTFLQVGYACQHASTLFRRARGMYFTAQDRGDMHAIMEVRVVVVVVVETRSLLHGRKSAADYNPTARLNIHCCCICIPLCASMSELATPRRRCRCGHGWLAHSWPRRPWRTGNGHPSRSVFHQGGGGGVFFSSLLSFLLFFFSSLLSFLLFFFSSLLLCFP